MTMLRVDPCSPAIAATVTDLDLSEPIGAEAMSGLWRAFHEHTMLVFRDQLLTPGQQAAFAKRWGTPLVVPALAEHAVPDHPSVLRVTNAGKHASLTENWHFDSAFFEHPPPITMLSAQHVPELGGDTMWANQYLAYERLSPTMQRLIDPLRIAFVGTLPDDGGGRREVVTYHPAVHTHPATGRKSLRTGRLEAAPHVEGMAASESRGLLEFLHDHASRPEFVYRHSWRAGDVVMWDNRCLLHYAIHDYGEARRLMHRVTVVDPTDQ
jgi:taurine dioxygenase